MLNRLLNLLRQIGVFFSQGVGKTAVQLEKHNEKNIDLNVVLSEFLRKSSKEIEDRKTNLKTHKAERETNIHNKADREKYLETAIMAMAKMEDIINDTTKTEEERTKASQDLRLTRIRASQALKIIEMLSISVTERTGMIETFETSIFKAEEEALEIRLELERLKMQKDLIITSKGMTEIKLNEQYDLRKLKEIVDSEQTLFKVSKEVDEKFGSNSEKIVEEYVNPSLNDAKLDVMLAEYKQKSKA